MRQKKSKRRTAKTARHGFTLVEMLVAVTLILLMMTMFAEIFTMATDSLSKQRGVAQNDQNARTLTTVIRSDVQHRTFRRALPYYPGESSATAPTSFTDRSGYLYISTNSRDSGLDDFIQFTVNADVLIENSDSTPYFGRATLLKDQLDSPKYPGGIIDPARSSLSLHPNQPEADDGSLQINGTGSSHAAEVCYFVRYGNLYRRVSLLRVPLAIAGKELNAQPTSTLGYNLLSAVDFGGSYDTGLGRYFRGNGSRSNNYMTEFDYSAIAANFGGAQHANVLSVDTLSNDDTLFGAPTSAAVTGPGGGLGRSFNRFGFNQATGLSREHSQVGGRFIGRFLHAESSSRNFNWPQSPARIKNIAEDSGAVLWSGNAAPGNPYDLQNAVTLNSGNGLVSEFDEGFTGEGRGGSRRVEDLLLSNVHELRIEVWDQRLGAFVPPGHQSVHPLTGQMGDYHQFRNLNPAFAPQGVASGGAVFDTWHPNMLSRDADPRPESSPPYLAYHFYPPRTSDSPPGPSQPGSAGPFGAYWQPDFNFTAVGTVVFVPWVDRHPITAATPDDGVFQYYDLDQPKFQRAFRLVVPGISGPVGSFTPLSAPGRTFSDGTCQWETIDNTRPLQSIRMTVRYIDQKTQAMRQVSLILPVSDKKL